MMSPEAKLAEYASRIHLQDEDVDYLILLLQEARGLGYQAGVEQEREACARIAETAGDGSTPAGKIAGEAVGWDIECMDAGIAVAIRARGKQA